MVTRFLSVIPTVVMVVIMLSCVLDVSFGDCTVDQFKCNNGKCISPKWVCDCDNDCGDWSDESDEKCPPYTCNDTNDQIPRCYVCDTMPDCLDESDEKNCTWAYTCSDGTQIPANWVCDGKYVDCSEGEDEQGCSKGDEVGRQIAKSRKILPGQLRRNLGNVHVQRNVQRKPQLDV